MSVISRVILLISSYAPLLTLFAILGSFGSGWPSYVCAGIALTSVIALLLVWMLQKSQLHPDLAKIEQSRSRDADVMAYVVSYVVPFAAAVNPLEDATRWALAVFALLIAVLYVRSAVFYVHPLLLLVGIHVYEATRDGAPVIVLTRRRHLRHEESMRVIKISESTYREVGP